MICKKNDAIKGAPGQQMSAGLRHSLSRPFVSRSFFSPTSSSAPLLRILGMDWETEDNMGSGPGKAEAASMGPHLMCREGVQDVVSVGCLFLSLAISTSPSSTSLPQTPPELPTNTARLMPLSKSKLHAAQSFQKASLKIARTLMQAADKAKEKQRSRHPSS